MNSGIRVVNTAEYFSSMLKKWPPDLGVTLIEERAVEGGGGKTQGSGLKRLDQLHTPVGAAVGLRWLAQHRLR